MARRKISGQCVAMSRWGSEVRLHEQHDRAACRTRIPSPSLLTNTARSPFLASYTNWRRPNSDSSLRNSFFFSTASRPIGCSPGKKSRSDCESVLPQGFCAASHQPAAPSSQLPAPWQPERRCSSGRQATQTFPARQALTVACGLGRVAPGVRVECHFGQAMGPCPAQEHGRAPLHHGALGSGSSHQHGAWSRHHLYGEALRQARARCVGQREPEHHVALDRQEGGKRAGTSRPGSRASQVATLLPWGCLHWAPSRASQPVWAACQGGGGQKSPVHPLSARSSTDRSDPARR